MLGTQCGYLGELVHSQGFQRHAVNENLVPCKKHQEKFTNEFGGNIISMNIPHRNEERSSTYFSRA
jgi:hypothetical protein